MLSANQVVAIRTQYEKMYQDTCDIVEYQKSRNEDGSTGFKEVTVETGIPCRLSYKSGTATGETESASHLTQDIEVFLSPDLVIEPGSKLVIAHLGRSIEFKCTGEPSIYQTHQELHLEIFKGWA